MAGARGAAAGELCDGYEVAQAVFGQCSRRSGLTAFAYLWRRFGPPWWGSDDHKELVSYILGTPHPEVFVTINLKALNICYAVGYTVTKRFQDAWMAPTAAWEAQFERWWVAHRVSAEDRQMFHQWEKRQRGDTMSEARKPPPAIQVFIDRYWKDRCDRPVIDEAVAAIGPHPRTLRRNQLDVQRGDPVVVNAITEGLRELYRPVWVRDCAINLFGPMTDAQAAGWTSADYSPYAGYGVPQEAMDAQRQEDALAVIDEEP
jgi:hypothetical protein